MPATTTTKNSSRLLDRPAPKRILPPAKSAPDVIDRIAANDFFAREDLHVKPSLQCGVN